MRRDYKYLYQRSPIPYSPAIRSCADSVWYTGPVWTGEQDRAVASRLGRQRAERRRAKTAGRWIFLAAASIVLMTMLPVLVVVGAVLLARVLWRRYVHDRRRRGAPVTTGPARASVRATSRRRWGQPDVTDTPDFPGSFAGKARVA
jgi:hypothetical protein